MDKEKSGKLIKEARMQKNYTQSELGNLLGVSNKAVSRWETGRKLPRCWYFRKFIINSWS